MNSRQRDRYSRQIRFSGMGEYGQQQILTSHAMIVGCGALGSVQAALLSRAGVGKITIIDRDFVEENNLQRQLLFDEDDAAAGMPKAIAAQRAIARGNSSIEVHAIVDDLSSSNAADLLSGAQVVLDGTDNFETRYLINDFSLSSGIPWIYGAAVGGYGLMIPVLPETTACLRCIYPDPPSGSQPTCETAGALNSITSLIAALQVAEATKILSGNVDRVRRKIITADLWNGPIREIDQPARDPECPACGQRILSWLSGEHRAPVSLCGRNAVQIHDTSRPLDLAELRARLLPLGMVRANEFALRFFLDSYELTVFPSGRAIIKGTTDVALARSLYSRYVGN